MHYIILGIILYSIYSIVKKKKQNTYTNQLNTFTELGFNLNQGIKKDDLLRWEGDEKAFEKDPWSLMLITLGQTTEKDPWTPLTNKCWDFDTEAIEDHGSYVDIIENLNRLSDNELKFTEIEDFVDIELDKAWVSFRLNEKEFKWDLKIDDDWVDMTLFQKIQKAIAIMDSKSHLYWFDTGGQSLVIGFFTNKEVKKIKRKTGLEFQAF